MTLYPNVSHSRFPAIASLLLTLGLAVLAMGLPTARAAAPDPLVRLTDLPLEPLLTCTNGTVERVEAAAGDDGGPVWRWRIEAGKTSTLAMRPEHPLFTQLRYFDRLDCELRIVGGSVNELSLRALGHVSGIRQYKEHQWTLALNTTERGIWQRRQLDLARPNWFPWDNPDGEGLDGFFKFEGLGLEPGTVVELRGVTLSRALLYVKPDYELPVTWPRKSVDAAGNTTFKSTYSVLNCAGLPTDVAAEVISSHSRFKVSITPATLALKAGKQGTFTVTATLSADDIAATPDLYAEPLLVRFTPAIMPGAAALAPSWLVRPLSPGLQRQVVISAADLVQVRTRLAAGDKALSQALNVNGVVREADAFLSKRLLAIPTPQTRVLNNWPTIKVDKEVHDLLPGDFMPEAVDPKGTFREVNTYNASLVWHEYLGHRGRALENLGLAYAYTGDEKYAIKAIELFELYAQQYTLLDWNNQFDPPWNRGPATLSSSRISTTSTYGSNWMFKGFCRLASLVADSPSWTPEARQRVYNGVVLPYATELMKFPGGISNMTDITNHNLLLLGLVFDDAGLVHFATQSDPGLLSRLRDIDADGFSAEGRPLNYHFAGMEEYLPSLAYLANAGLKLDYPKERLLLAMRMPYRRAALTGRVPNTGDCGRYLNTPPSTPLADDLLSIFPDEEWLVDIGQGRTVTSALRRLTRATPPSRDAWKALLETTPTLFPAAGLGILRQGDTAATQVSVTLDYGRNLFHAALDRQQVTLSAFGATYSHGPGSLYNAGSGGMTRGTDAKLDAFCSHGSLGQNVVLIDSEDQDPAVGRLLAWSAKPEYQSIVSQVDGLKPGVSHVRGMVLSHGVVVLLDRVTATTPRTVDVVWHNFGTLALGDGWTATPRAKPLATTALYDQLGDLQTLDGTGTLRATWTLPTEAPTLPAKATKADAAAPATMPEPPLVRLGFWQLPVAGSAAYSAVTGMNNPNTNTVPDRAPSIIRRVPATQTTTVVTVLDPYRDTPGVTAVAPLGTAGVTVTLADGSAFSADLDALLKAGVEK